jgi:anti-sigma B factor antagonist
MQIDISKDHDVTVITPRNDRIDFQVAGELRDTLLKSIGSGHRNLVIDLGGVSFIDSSGLGAFVSAFKMLNTPREGDGDIRLANPQPPVVELLEIIRLNRVFQSYPSVADAAESFLVEQRAS